MSLPLVCSALLGTCSCQLGEISTRVAPDTPHDDAFDAGPSVPEDAAPMQVPEGFTPPEGFALPDGFTLNEYARDLGATGVLRTHGEHVYLTRPAHGDVLRLIDRDRDGVAESHVAELSNLGGVHGIAFHEQTAYVATPYSVYSMIIGDDGSFGFPCGILGELPDGGKNAQRMLGVGPDRKLYVSVASTCESCEETNPNQITVLRAELDGSGRTTFAGGDHRSVGFGWYPQTVAMAQDGALLVTDSERGVVYRAHAGE